MLILACRAWLDCAAVIFFSSTIRSRTASRWAAAPSGFFNGEKRFGLRISPAKITLLPNGNQAFKVSLTGTDTLKPGGHYAAIVLKLVNNSNQPLTNRVQINQDVSMLLFTTTNGSGVRNLSLSPPGVGAAWFHMPQILNLFLTNNGNTQATPRGYTTIFNTSNKPLSRSIVNSGSALVLPGSTRLLETPTNAKLKPFWPGVYRLQVAYTYDGASHLNYYNASFVYISLPFVVILTAAILALFSLQFLRRRFGPRYRAKR